MIFLRTLIVAFIVTGILDLLAKKSKRKTASSKKFVVRAPLDFAGLGTIVKAFVFKRHWKFSDIICGRVTRGGMKIYVEGRKRKAFFVDGMCEGYSNFLKRMEKDEKEMDCPKED